MGSLRSLLILVALASVSFANEADERRADTATQEGARLFENGSFEAAVDQWRHAAEFYRRSNRTADLIDTLGYLGGCYHALGQQRLAVDAFQEAIQLARDAHDRERLATSLSNLGAISIFSRSGEAAEQWLREALALAREEKAPALLASVLNNLGNLLAAQEKFPDALASYHEAIAFADAAGEKELQAKALANLAQSAVASGDFEHASKFNDAAIKAASALPDSHKKAFTFLRVGKTWEEIFDRAPAHERKRRAAALNAYHAAAATAEEIGDDGALSYALGYSGHLYEQEKRSDDALRLTSRATFLAQKIQAPDILYQWEWQSGRILRAQGRRDDAIDACKRATVLLAKIRTDLSARLGNVNAHSSFREAVGGVYFDLADLLLQLADGIRDEKQLAACLMQARDVCEQLKSVELEDYFQDDCVSLLKKKRESVEDVLQPKPGADPHGAGSRLAAATRTTAVIYFIPLHDRTETILSLSDGLHRVKLAVGAERLTETVRTFRQQLEKRTTNEYLVGAWQLYDWLIRPLDPLLAEHKIDTLVFIPDGALRTIPMAALHDRQKFLVEKYAVAVTPGLTLMEPRPIARENLTLMASGLSDSVQGYPALPFVDSELKQVGELYRAKPMMNRAFLADNVTKEFDEHSYSIVHIASHGEFSGDVNKTFVLTYDDHFTLDALEKLIRPSQLRDHPVELLTLSACQTAAGDDRSDRAALGLAGIAVKAGARAAFATLWNVSDQASTNLVTEFYTTLRDQPQLSKAQALQKAQVNLLGDERFSHPCLWAPYLIIGNWL